MNCRSENMSYCEPGYELDPGFGDPDWANFTADQWDTFTADQWSGFQVNSHFRATYDAWNRLVKVTGAEGTVQENEYDGRGYRIVTKAYTDGTLSETRHAYFTNQWQCIEERLGTSTTPDRQFIWGVRYIDDLILRDRSVSGGTLNERLYALQDANWNVTAVADDAGAVQERYEYDPYGVTTVLSPTFTVRPASDFNWEITYTGYRSELTFPLFVVRHRYYSPVAGVWLQRDPAGARVDKSLYGYGASDPLNTSDATGLRPIKFRFAAFIPKRLSESGWFPEPGATGWEFQGDERECGEVGTQRLFSEGVIESTHIGGATSVAADHDTGLSHRRKANGGGEVQEAKADPRHSTRVSSTRDFSVRPTVCRTVVQFQAEAAYPFRPWAGGFLPTPRFLVPNIDYTVQFTFEVESKNKVRITVNGVRNSFPDYEGIVDVNGRRTLYCGPTAGSGPGLYNLGFDLVMFSSQSIVVDAETSPCCTD